MKHHARLGLAALLAAMVLALASCGAGEPAQNGDEGAAGTTPSPEATQEASTAARGSEPTTDMGGMGHGTPASEMLMENGSYSDERFIDAMVPHHQGAVEMARVALENAEHEEIRQLSENIVSTQRAEIEELKSIKQEEFGTSRVPMQMSPEQMADMGMMTDPQELANQEPFDRAFIDAMIPHHRSAIEMAEVASDESSIPRIKELAGEIITTQQQEIEQLQQWREVWYPKN